NDPNEHPMNEASAITSLEPDAGWIPSKGAVGMTCLIIAESAIFTIFVVAYLYYLGRDLGGPTPRQVLELPILNSICLLSSSATIAFAIAGLVRQEHAERAHVLGLYWHFVDAVWIVVFTVVYIIGR